MWVRNTSHVLQRFECKKATCWFILFSLHKLLRACLHCLLGVRAAGFGQPQALSPWAPQESSLGPSCLSDPFGCFFPVHPVPKETSLCTWHHLRLLSAVNHTEHLLSCPERSGEFRCLRGTWAEKVPGSSAVASVLWTTTGKTLPFLGVIWEPFNSFSRKTEQTCHSTKRLSVESLLLPGPDSGALSLKGAVSGDDSPLVSRAIKILLFKQWSFSLYYLSCSCVQIPGE